MFISGRTRLFCAALVAAMLAGCNGDVRVKASSNNGTDSSQGGGSVVVNSRESFERIINGSPVSRSESPQFVLVRTLYADGTEGTCTGTVVGPGETLTAAHCVSGDISEVKLNFMDRELSATNIIIAPGFRVEPENNAIFLDAAILKSEPHGAPALPIAIGPEILPGSLAVTYGFGLDAEGNSGNLNAGPVSIDVVTENHLFSSPFSGDQSNPCFGDSGGPAIARFQGESGDIYGLVGLVSSGTLTDCSEGDVTLFTNLRASALVTFLTENVPNASFF